MIYLELDDLVEQLTRVGFMVRDYGLLESALARPQATVFGEDAYPTLELKTAAMMHSIIKNHALMDGNKRCSWFALNTVLYLNQYELRASADEGFDFILAVATDELDLDQMATWIRDHMHIRP